MKDVMDTPEGPKVYIGGGKWELVEKPKPTKDDKPPAKGKG